jgi:hypothetical protein
MLSMLHRILTTIRIWYGLLVIAKENVWYGLLVIAKENVWYGLLLARKMLILSGHIA